MSKVALKTSRQGTASLYLQTSKYTGTASLYLQTSKYTIQRIIQLQEHMCIIFYSMQLPGRHPACSFELTRVGHLGLVF